MFDAVAVLIIITCMNGVKYHVKFNKMKCITEPGGSRASVTLIIVAIGVTVIMRSRAGLDAQQKYHLDKYNNDAV